ncbi:MAG TPA: hypothetical protein VFA26_24290 [Gemmataceae bacterium]|nr:hypothetical protein [Gemmataceae bacterium]
MAGPAVHAGSPKHAAGVHSGLARWWAVRAGLLARRGDGQGAAAAWREAVTRCRHVDARPQAAGPHTRNPLARTLHHLGRRLAANGDLAAEAAFAESRSCREMIGLPPFDRGDDAA